MIRFQNDNKKLNNFKLEAIIVGYIINYNLEHGEDYIVEYIVVDNIHYRDYHFRDITHENLIQLLLL